MMGSVSSKTDRRQLVKKMPLVIKPSLIKLCIVMRNIFYILPIYGIFQDIFLCCKCLYLEISICLKTWRTIIQDGARQETTFSCHPLIRLGADKFQQQSSFHLKAVLFHKASYSQQYLINSMAQRKYWTSTDQDPAQRNCLMIFFSWAET